MIHSESETERYYPGRWYPTWIRFAHHSRYTWAASFVRGLRVLDAACGTGYGSAMLLDAGASYVEGVDLSSDGIKEAKTRCRKPGIVFREGSVLGLDSPDASFDAVVSFETIEHVEDDVRYVREMRRVLKPGGVFLCSTPNRNVTNPGKSIHGRPYNPHHVREYNATELYALLNKEFGDVTVIGQKMWTNNYCITLARIASLFAPMVSVRVHQSRKMLQSPLDTRNDYDPSAIPDACEPETLVVKCL